MTKPANLGTLKMLHETLRIVLLETADAYRALTEEDSEAALQHLRNVLAHAERTLTESNQKTSEETERAAKLVAYTVPDRPDGFSSIVGFALREGIYDWRNDDDEIVRDSLIDSRTVMKYVKDTGQMNKVHKWEAPEALKAVGIQQVNIYPETILRAVLAR